jgi:hypothetical protein
MTNMNHGPRKGVCAWCTYFQPYAPIGWKRREYDEHGKPILYDWVVSCREKHGEDAILAWREVGGLCTVASARFKVTGGEGCAQYLDKSLPSPRQLVDLYCKGTNEQKNLRLARQDIKALKHHLAFSRKRSRKRLEKIRVLETKLAANK